MVCKEVEMNKSGIVDITLKDGKKFVGLISAYIHSDLTHIVFNVPKNKLVVSNLKNNETVVRNEKAIK